MICDMTQPNPDYRTPKEGTVVGIEWKHGGKLRRWVIWNGRAVPENIPEGTCNGDGQEDEDND